jgi:hypothetical protein
MKYKVERNTKYDFTGQSYASKYPNYIAIFNNASKLELNFKEFNIKKEVSLTLIVLWFIFCCWFEVGINEMLGFDLNLLCFTTKAKFTKIDDDYARDARKELRKNIFEF